MNTPNTLARPQPTPFAAAGAAARLSERIAALLVRVWPGPGSAPGGKLSAAAAALLRLADTYEGTQPSYAADLRAAAERQG